MARIRGYQFGNKYRFAASITIGGVATSVAVTLSSSSGTQGSPVTATYRPNGNWPAGLVLTPTSTVFPITSSPATLSPVAGTNTPVSAAVTPTNTGTGNISATFNNPGLTISPAIYSSIILAGGSSPTQIDTFDLVNWHQTNSSAVYYRAGRVYAQGQVPAGTSLQIKRGTTVVPSQYDDITRWSDGSLKRAVLQIRDDGFTIPANTAQTYAEWTLPGNSFNNTGIISLATAAAAYPFVTTLSNLTETADGTAYTAVGSGTFQASFQTMAATATRVEKYRSGGVVEGFIVWDYFRDTTGGAADAHLKCEWFVDFWKNPDGSIYDVEVGPIVEMNEWSVPNKRTRHYDCTVKNGTTTLVSYTGQDHFYRGHFLPALNDGSLNRGRRVWANGHMPTLWYRPNQASWVASGLMPDLNTARIRSDLDTTNTMLLGSMFSYNQRADIDGTGGYDGRGVIPNTANQAFVHQSASNTAVMRVNALAGLSAPNFWRSNRLRTRPGETTADVANTPIAMRFYTTGSTPLPGDDFTADGMPVAVDAYSDYRTPTNLKDNYVEPGNGNVSPGSYWKYTTADGAHAVNYSGFGWLFDGERYLYDAVLAAATNLVHMGLGNGLSEFPALNKFNINAANGAPSEQYSAIAMLARQERSTGWGINNVAWAAGLVPDNHVAARFVKRFSQQQTLYLAKLMQYMPASEIAAGISPVGNSGISGLTAPWMANFSVVNGYHAARITEDPVYAQWAGMLGNWIANAIDDGPAVLNSYRACNRPKTGPWVAGTNEAGAHALLVYGYCGASTASPRMTVQDPNSPEPWSLFANGDVLYVQTLEEGGGSLGAPRAGMVEGVPYYVAGIQNAGTNTPSFTVNTKADGTGTTIAFAPATGSPAVGGDDFRFMATPAGYKALTVGNYGAPYRPSADDYAPIALAGFREMRRAGHPKGTKARDDKVATYLANVPWGDFASWDYRAAA